MRIVDNIALIDSNTGEYPVYLAVLKQRHPELTSISVIYEEDVTPLGYYIVYPTPRPTDGVATEAAPSWDGVHYVQTWTTRPFTEGEKADILRYRKNDNLNRLIRQLDAEYRQGAPYTFPDQQTLSVSLTLEGRVNLLGLHHDALQYISDTDPDPQAPLLAINTREKVIQYLTPVQMRTLGFFALDVFQRACAKAWELEAQINQATQLSELPILPVSIIDEAVAAREAEQSTA